jgi:hypothetical protein
MAIGFMILSIMFNDFIQINLIDMITLPLHVALHVTLYLQPHFHSLQLAGPSQYPQVDKPHFASVTSTLPAVAGPIPGAPGTSMCRRCWMVQVSRRELLAVFLSQDTFNWHNIENWFFYS